MLLYILKSTFILALLLLFYKLILEKERIHTFKRFFLLASVVIAIGIPAITFTTYVETKSNLEPIFTENSLETSQTIATTDYFNIALFSIYILGVLFFSIRFLVNLVRLFNKISINEKVRASNLVNVLLDNLQTPHTFFKYIFFNKEQFKSKSIPEEVKIHEHAHAKQLHSFDIICVEILQILFWFNPFIYLLKNNIRLNHEFLADAAVLQSGIVLRNYQNILLEHSCTYNKYPIANAINYSSIKKRFNIMKTKTSPKILWLKSILALPLLAILIYGFSEKEVIEKQTILNQNQVKDKSQDSNSENYLINNNKYQKNKSKQDKATPEELAEYNKLAKHYNTMSKNEMVVKSKDVKRLRYIYNLMTKAQKASAEPFPNFPPPPPPPPTMNENQIKKGSKELQILSKKFNEKTDNYLKAIKSYFKTKENYEDLKPLYDEMMKSYEKFAKKAKQEKLMAPPPPPPIPSKQTSIYNPSYKEYITEMNTKGARFYFENDKISYKKALELKSTYGKINMLTQSDNGKPVVFLSRKEITKKDIKVNGGTTNGWSATGVSNETSIAETLPKDADFYIDGKKVSHEKVKALDVDTIKRIDVKKKEGEKGSVFIILK